jgi:hypothetical protein
MRFASFFLPSFLLFAACGGESESSTTSATTPTTPAAKAPETNRGENAPTSSTPATWCTTAGPHDFCADFDGERAFEPFDDAYRGNDRNQKDIDELTSSDRSSPNALRIHGGDITVEAESDSSSWVWSGMFLAKKLPTTTSTTATIALDLYVEEAKGSTGVIWLSGITSENTYAFRIGLDVDVDGTTLSAGGSTLEKLPRVPQGRWVRVEIAIDDNGGAGGSAALAFDGENAGTAPFEGSLADSVETTLYLGVLRSAPSEAYDVRYDNVIIDLH